MSHVERAFLDRHRVARLATADADASPHVIPIVYALVDDRIYFVIDDKPKRTRTRLKRLRNIQVNPQVALIIDDYDEDWTQLAFLLLHGQAGMVADRNEYKHALEVLRERYPQYRQMPLAFETHPMVRLTLNRRHFWRADASGGSAGRW